MSGAQQMLVGGGEPLVTLTNQNVSEVNVGSPSSATYIANSNGSIQQSTIGGGTTTLEQWITPAVGMSGYEVRATLNSGSLTTGTTGSWLTLGSTQSWNCAQSVVGTKTANLTIEIRNATTLVVKASCTVIITATES